MKIVQVGVGGMGSVHFNIYKNMQDIEYAAVCDIRTDMLKQKVGDFPVRIYADYDEMLAAEKPDMVDICTPTYLHVEMAIKAMEAGAHVLSEKPMSLTAEEADKLLAVIKKTGKRYMTAQVVRFMNAYAYLRGLIESKKHGKLESLSMHRVSQTPRWSWDNWFLDEKRSGHVIMDLMIHDIDFMQSVLGEPKDIVGIYHPMTDNYSNYAIANYIYDGCSATIETGWYNYQKMSFEVGFRALFENGSLLFKDGKLTECGEAVDFNNVEKIGETGMNISNVDGYAGEIKYFIDCIKSGEDNRICTPISAAATIKLVERTLDSLTKL
ncbi:MAG: Gfo/Idh/MocA family oxidoreductase [Clostridia bacterium]|nr:Gfo/Idh/MocA family oxidoreductase [Clostridia bacterium]